jgi:serine/threonine protein kinase
MQCSLGYAPPEILRAFACKQPTAAHPSHDIWSLGVVVFEALTDTQAIPPFVNSAEVLAAAEAGNVEYPWERRPPLAQFARSKVRPIVEACLRRDPALRPSAADVRGMVDSIGQMTSTQTTSERQESSLDARVNDTFAWPTAHPDPPPAFRLE